MPSKKHLENFGYLFLIDIDSLNRKSYASFEGREPKYSEALLSAYHFAFSVDLNHQLNRQFIQDVHEHAMQHMPLETPGICKKSSNFFPLGFPTCLMPDNQILKAANPTATADGFWQFVDNWMLNIKFPAHYVHIRSGSDELYFLPVNPLNKAEMSSGPCIQLLQNKRLVAVSEYNSEVKQPINKWLFNKPSEAFINSISPELAPFCGYEPGSMERIMHEHLDRICMDYNSAIKVAKTDKEKIAVIVKHAQLIIQLHAFKDGNTRLCYLLINRLLFEEKLPLTLLINPNRLDCFSVYELVGIVQAGQNAYLQFCEEKTTVFHGVFCPEQKFCVPDLLIQQFDDIITKNLYAIGFYELVSSTIASRIL